MALTQLSPTATPGHRYQFTPKGITSGEHTGGPFTELSVTATPGGIHNFSAKTGVGEVKGEGPFTELSVTATPGQIHSFLAKEPAIPTGKGIGPFTELSVMALPGMRHAFSAKEAAPIGPGPEVPTGDVVTYTGGAMPGRPRYRIYDDEELMEFIEAIVTSGLLD